MPNGLTAATDAGRHIGRTVERDVIADRRQSTLSNSNVLVFLTLNPTRPRTGG